MNDRRDIDLMLQAYLDGLLTPEEEQAVTAHLEAHPEDRAAYEALRSVREDVAALPGTIDPPEDLWPGIAARLQAPAARSSTAAPAPLRRKPPAPDARPARPPARRARRFAPAHAAALTLVLMVAGAALWVGPRLFATTWEVDWAAAPGGGPPPALVTTLRAGQWLRTDASSVARLRVGAIGHVEVAPNSSVRLLRTSPQDHRLALSEGEIHAKIWAPPRLFFVETPSALAIDLGCEYTLTVDSTGASLLHVTSGYVALEGGDRSVVVPAGAMGLTRPGFGPGTPFDEAATPAFRAALARYDFEGQAAEALGTLLAEARASDAITLWNLLYTLEGEDQARLYDRLAALVTPPEAVTREGTLQGDPAMAEAWKWHLGLEVDTWWPF